MRSALVVPLVLVLGLASAQRDMSKSPVTVTPVAGAVSMLVGEGGNVGVSVGPDGVLMIDTQFPDMREKLLAAIAGLQQPGAPRLIVNTHWHGDHTGGNAGLGKTAEGQPGALILAQDNVRERMQKGREGQPPAPPEALPAITFAEGVTLHMNGDDIAVRHFAHGHTDGDSVLLFPHSKAAHLGDLFFNGRFPFVDLASGGDVVGLQHAVEALLKEIPADWKIIPGHGDLATHDDLQNYARMLADSVGHVKAALAKGQTKEQIVAAGVPEEWKSWSWQFVSADRWLGTVFDSLKANPDGPAGR
jgi:cyclase